MVKQISKDIEKGPIPLRLLGGVDAPGGNTRSHLEHDGEDSGGRWYYIGNDVGEQVDATLRTLKTAYIENICDQIL